MKTNRNLPKPPQRKNRDNWSLPASCPCCAKANTLEERIVASTQLIRGEDTQCQVKKWVCAECGAAFMSPTQATEAVKVAVTAYQQNHSLLTANEIRNQRQARGISASELAHKAKIGEATVKRLEAGTTVQQTSTNELLSLIFAEELELPEYQVVFESEDCSDSYMPTSDADLDSDSNLWSMTGYHSNAANSNELSLAA
ncbi:MAG: hypothetical protein NTV46_03840 [Verrucomicrobia bacterium]|nr:hypothetical protein [Verrucomicrobiota bacterium]